MDARSLIAPLLAVIGALGAPAAPARAVPPFSGTIFIDPDIITPADPTVLVSVTATGQAPRLMFDQRVNAFVLYNAWLFEAVFTDTTATIEVQINPEFSQATGLTHATTYAREIGRLPLALRAGVETVWIHGGVQPFGGGNNNILIHVGQAALHVADGILEETLLHEACHSLDAAHGASPGWIASQAADGEFISIYARDNPTHEDIAESFLPYFALRYRSERISQSLANTIEQTIPNRIAYFDAQFFNMHPYLVAGHNDPTLWATIAGCGVQRAAFDSSFPGLAGAVGCLAPGDSFTLQIPGGGSMTAAAYGSTGLPVCALQDSSTAPAVSDILLPLNGSVLLTFERDITAFYALFGSLNVGAFTRMELFDSAGGAIDLEQTRPSTHTTLALGRGFVSSVPVRSVRFTSTDSGGSTIGAFTGLAPGVHSLGTVTIPDYPGPAGPTVQFDFAVRFVPLAFDLNDDGLVGSPDLGILLGSWGLCPAPPAECGSDVNADGLVNSADLSQLLGAWGATAPVCP